MSTGMPELGSKISLISKADIRYEGRLFTVDPQECTIALASVRSFGTEDRETQYPVPAQNQVYDYILFRGSDIKDIRVINNVPTLPNDPAIMQLSVPPSLGQQQFQSQGYSHPVLGPMGPSMGQFNAGYGGMGGIGGGLGAPGMGLGGQGPRGVPSKPTSVLDLIAGGSRSTTPASLGSRKSPTADQAVQVSGAGKKDDKRISRPIQPPGYPHRNQPKDRRDSKGESGQYSSNNDARQQNRQMQHHQHRPNNQQMQGNHQIRQPSGWGPMPRGGQQRPRGPRTRGGPGGGGPNNTNNFRQNQQTNPGNKQKNTLKFDNDYDFEQANTQFEELRSQLDKLKLKDGKPEVNGDNEKKDDSGNETGAGEGEQEEEEPVYYDKSKSFFDNISCEAVERSKGRSQRTDWRAERKLNSETFGVASTRRSGYRGRGGFYNRGGYRPGYRGGYRPQGNQQNRRINQDGRSGTYQNQQSSSSAQPSSSNPTTTTTTNTTATTNTSQQQSVAAATTAVPATGK